MATTLLIVDDERTTRLALSEAFGQRGYQVDVAASGDEALEMLTAVTYDTVLLDLQMPGLTGDQILAMADDIAPDTAFVVLTAYASADTAITALRSGAVDYLRKPSSFQRIFAAIEKAAQTQQTRREQQQATFMLSQIKQTLEAHTLHTTPSPANNDQALDLFQVGSIQIDQNQQTVTQNDIAIDLTPIEYRLLHTLASQPNIIHSYADLAQNTHDADLEEDEARTLLRTHIYRLRRKLSGHGATPIQVVRGRGIMLQS